MGGHLEARTLLSDLGWTRFVFPRLRHRLEKQDEFSSVDGGDFGLAMYGLSFTAIRLWASSTRRLMRLLIASADGAGEPDPEPEAGVGPLDTVGECLTGTTGATAFTGVGAARPRAGFFIAASFAAISARFWAMRAAPVS